MKQYPQYIQRNKLRAFALIEVVIAVLVLGIAVPPTLNMMESASAGRVDAINTTRATYLSTIVLETILADMTSNHADLGFEALDDSGVYLSAPNTGLYNRLTTIVQSYTDVGFKYSVTIGELVSSDGQVSATAGDNIFRTITVRVQYASASGAEFSMPTSLMVSEL